MADIFKLFDGTLNSGGASAIDGQTAGSFSDVEDENDLVALLASGSDSVELLVDYSDFSNFVWFNSAESYLLLTADKVVNEYPLGGSAAELREFVNSLDGYQRYVLANWPNRGGHLRLNPANGFQYVKLDDIGAQDGAARTCFMSPGTGSFAIQGWIDVPPLTGSEDVQVVIQKLQQETGDGYTVFVSGSAVHCTVTSGSSTSTLSATVSEMPSFFCVSCDRSTATGSLSLFTATTGTFPTLRDSADAPLFARFDLASGSFFIASGSVEGKTVRPFTGSVDDISFWSIPRTLQALSSSFNRKVYGQNGLTAVWRFNEMGPSGSLPGATIVRDYSGHRIDGRIINYTPSVRGSGSLCSQAGDPILSFDDPSLLNYLVTSRETATIYDRDNPSLIFNFFPEVFSSTDSASVFRTFALVYGRFFDKLKLYISKLTDLRNVSYDGYDQAPDELLQHVADSLGWDLEGSFVTVAALKYFLGRDVIDGPSANLEMSQRLSDIKASFWRRTLLNMLYVYKTKGTRESVDALLRTHGANSGFVRLKEYARKAEARFEPSYVTAEKSFGAARFVSGAQVTKIVPLATDFTIEARVRFPVGVDSNLTPTLSSGTIFTLTGPLSSMKVCYDRSVSSTTGTIYLSSSAGRLELAGSPIFNDQFYSFALVRESQTGSLSLSVQRHDGADRTTHLSTTAATGTAAFPPSFQFTTMSFGGGEFFGNELRAWGDALLADEIEAHSINFESYGRNEQAKNSRLLTHIRLGETVGGVALDSVPNAPGATVTSFSDPMFVRFLDQYSYIPSIEYGWNQDKVRVYSSTKVDPWERYIDERFVSLEFNMYDALNEDISHLMTSYDELNVAIGLPVNRYREDYEGLQAARELYFKRLQGKLNFNVFVEMLRFFDTSFVSMIKKVLPARAIFKGDELVVESHMLERPKYQYQLRPVIEGVIDISGSIGIVDREWD